MPYSSISDIPDNIKKLPTVKQRRWMEIFNEVFDRTKEESSAFRAANAIIKESANMKKTMELGTINLSEAISESRIEPEKGILQNVVLLTGNKITHNKTFYTSAALNEARDRYEGAKMFLDHPKQGETNRSIRDFGGVYSNIRVEENKLKGDLHVVEDLRRRIFGIAQMRPQGVGLSIKDRGRGSEKDGVFMVESFVKNSPYSIDFVSEASANQDLWESLKQEEEDMKWEDITIEALKEKRSEIVDALLNEGKSSVLNELEEAKKKGDDAESVKCKADKLVALYEANFDKEMFEHVKKMIEPKALDLETAKNIIASQKEISEAIFKKKGNDDPDVKARQRHQPTDGNKEVPTIDEIAEAFKK